MPKTKEQTPLEEKGGSDSLLVSSSLKRGMKGKVKRGKGVGEGGNNEGKRVGGKGSESALEKLRFWDPMIL